MKSKYRRLAVFTCAVVLSLHSLAALPASVGDRSNFLDRISSIVAKVQRLLRLTVNDDLPIPPKP